MWKICGPIIKSKHLSTYPYIPESVLYRGSPHFVISQFVIPAISWFCLRPQFREKKSKKFYLYQIYFFLFFVYIQWLPSDEYQYFLIFRQKNQKACNCTLWNATAIVKKKIKISWKRLKKWTLEFFWTLFKVLH